MSKPIPTNQNMFVKISTLLMTQVAHRFPTHIKLKKMNKIIPLPVKMENFE